MFPLIHVGRPWVAYWMLPASPHDEHLAAVPFAVAVGRVRGVDLRHHLCGVLVYMGMIPDFGTLRDRSESKIGQYVYGILSVGWRGSTRHWMRYETGISAAGRPGNASGALGAHGHQFRLRRGGFARLAHYDLSALLCGRRHLLRLAPLVLTLAIPLRKFYHLEALVTERHIDNMGKVMLATGFIVAYGYGMEAFMAWYSASHWEAFMFWKPHVRSDGLGLLGADCLQPGYSADDFVVAQAAHQHRLHVLHFHRGEHRHVV